MNFTPINLRQLSANSHQMFDASKAFTSNKFASNSSSEFTSNSQRWIEFRRTPWKGKQKEIAGENCNKTRLKMTVDFILRFVLRFILRFIKICIEIHIEIHIRIPNKISNKIFNWESHCNSHPSHCKICRKIYRKNSQQDLAGKFPNILAKESLVVNHLWWSISVDHPPGWRLFTRWSGGFDQWLAVPN